MKDDAGSSSILPPETPQRVNGQPHIARPNSVAATVKYAADGGTPKPSEPGVPAQATGGSQSVSALTEPTVSKSVARTSSDALVERSVVPWPALEGGRLNQLRVDGSVAERLASEFMHKLCNNGRTLRRRELDLLRYDGTHWVVMADQQAEAELRYLAHEIDLASEKRATFREALRLLRVYAEPAHGALMLGAPAARVINLANGELWLYADGTTELKPHRPETGLDYVLPFAYDPTATCEIFDQALAAIFANAKAPASLINLVWELIGYIVSPDRSHAMVIVFLGEGANGKSMIVKVIQRLLPPYATLLGSLSRMTTAPASLKSLRGKRLFVDTDVAADLVWSDALLKRMSESTPLTINLGRQGDVTFENGAVPLLLCNSPPGLRDVTHGMRRRLVVVPFDRTFAPDEIDVTLLDRIVATELAGILNKAVAGWQRLMRDGRLIEGEDAEAARIALLTAASPLLAFIGDECVVEKGCSVKRSTFFSAYRVWAEASGRHIGKATSEELAQLGLRVKKVHGDYFIEGLRLKDERD